MATARRQVFAQHFDEVATLDVFGMAAVADAQWVQVRLAAELHDAFGQQVGVRLFLPGMLEEFVLDGLAHGAAGHEVVAAIAQHTNDLGGQA